MRPRCSHSNSTAAWHFERLQALARLSSSSKPQTETLVRPAGDPGSPIPQSDPPQLNPSHSCKACHPQDPLGFPCQQLPGQGGAPRMVLVASSPDAQD